MCTAKHQLLKIIDLNVSTQLCRKLNQSIQTTAIAATAAPNHAQWTMMASGTAMSATMICALIVLNEPWIYKEQ